MPKCKYCMPAGEIDCRYCAEVATVKNDAVKMGDPITCNKNVFPGFAFCPQHLSDRGMNVGKLTAEYIADKEQ